MSKIIHLYIKQGLNTYKFREKALSLGTGSTMTLKKLIALWRFENVPQDEQVTLTSQDGSVTQLVFGQGYWTFSDLQKQFAESDVTLTPVLHSNTCRISSLENTVNLGSIGPLLGFLPNTVIQRGLTKDSKRVNINQGLESLVISSNLVDDQNVFDSSGEHSQVIAVLPIDITQRLNGTMTNYGELEFSAPIFNGNVRQFTITVGENLLRTAIKLHLFAEWKVKKWKVKKNFFSRTKNLENCITTPFEVTSRLRKFTKLP